MGIEELVSKMSELKAELSIHDEIDSTEYKEAYKIAMGRYVCGEQGVTDLIPIYEKYKRRSIE